MANDQQWIKVLNNGPPGLSEKVYRKQQGLFAQTPQSPGRGGGFAGQETPPPTHQWWCTVRGTPHTNAAKKFCRNPACQHPRGEKGPWKPPKKGILKKPLTAAFAKRCYGCTAMHSTTGGRRGRWGSSSSRCRPSGPKG